MWSKSKMKLTQKITDQEIQDIWDAKRTLLQAYSLVRTNSNTWGMVGGLLVLFLLALHNDELLRKGGADLLRQRGSLRNAFKDQNINKTKQKAYSGIRNFLVQKKAVTLDVVQDAVSLVLKIRLDLIKDKYFALFDQALFGFLGSENTTENVHVLPFKISRFMHELANVKPTDRVYNPFAGMASFGLFDGGFGTYFGQENEQKAYYLGMLRSLAYGTSTNFQYRCEDSMKNGPDVGSEYDLLISSPPFITSSASGEHDESAGEWLLNPERLSKILSSRGRFVLLLSEEILFKEGNCHQIRKYLVENNLLEYVITFPGGMLSHTGVSTVVLVGNKEKKSMGVKFVDTKEFLTKETTSVQELEVDKLLEQMESGDNGYEESNSIKIAYKDIIKENDYLLLKNRYNMNAFEGKLLAEILVPIGEEVNSLNFGGKVVRVKDLRSAGDLEINVAYETLEHHAFKEGEKGLKVKESCILIAIQGDALKPTYFKFVDDPIYVGPNVKAFKIQSPDKIDVNFVIFELRANPVNEQLEHFRFGSVAHRLSMKDFLRVKIESVPAEIEEQRNRAKLLRVTHEKIEELEADQDALVEKKNKENFDETASLKHTLARPLANISAWSDTLHNFLKNQNAELIRPLNDKFEQYYENGYDIFKVLNEVNDDARYITDLMEHAENGIVLSEFPMNLITVDDINIFLDGILRDRSEYKLVLKLEESEVAKEQGIQANLRLLQILIENLLLNAEVHGFQDFESPTKEVVVETRLIEDGLVLEIKNTGHPFSENYSRDNYIQKFNTSQKNGRNQESVDVGQEGWRNRGLGGYDVNRIAAHFGSPDWKLILKPTAFYTVRFIFEFPIEQIK